MKKLFFLMIIGFCLANNYFFYQENTDLTAEAINYRIKELNLKDNQLSIKLDISNLSESPVLINPDQWRLNDGRNKKPLKKNKSQLLLPQNLGQYQVDFDFSKNEDLFLTISQNIRFNLKYFTVNEKAYQKFYSQSSVIIQENDHFFLDRTDRDYLLFKNNDQQQLVSEVYLVVPDKNIALTKLDSQHFVSKQNPLASHLIIYYHNNNKKVVKLTGLAHYFPKDIQIQHSLENGQLTIRCLTERSFIKVTAVIDNQSYPLQKNKDGYFLAVKLKKFQKIKIYLKQKYNLYSYLIVPDKFNRNP